MKSPKPKPCKKEQTMDKVYNIFAELLKLCPRYQFEKATERYRGNRYVKTFTTWQHYISILYSQITQKDSLRDIETGLGTQSSRWYHLGGSKGCAEAPSLTRIQKETIGFLRICSITFWHGAGI